MGIRLCGPYGLRHHHSILHLSQPQTKRIHEWALLTKTDGGWRWPGGLLTPGVESLGWVQDKGQLALSSYLRMTV